MKKNYFVIAVTIAVILLLVNMTLDVYQNVEKEFDEVYTRNALLIESRLTKLTDTLEFNGERAKRLIKNVDLYTAMEQEKYDEIYEYFEYDGDRDIFHLDNIQNHEIYSTTISNITGIGNLDFLEDKQSLKSKEIGLALLLNNDINIIDEKIESNEWIHYTSLNDFIIIKNKASQFVDSNKFYYSQKMLDREYITKGQKDVLKDRKSIFWTEPYVDMINQDILITTSYPIDYEDEYIGSLSVGFKASKLRILLDDDYSSFLLNDDGKVLATNVEGVDIYSKLTHFNELDNSITFEDLENAKENNLKRVNGARVLAGKIKGTPYTIYQVYFLEDAIMEYVTKLLPIVICLILFVVVTSGYKKLLKSEKELKQHKEELDYLANYDTLTKVLNRRGLFRELDRVDKDNLSIIILDVDHFKKVNDTYGHDIGDYVLEKISEIIANYIGEDGIISRYGGEEFLIAIKDKTIEESIETAEYIRTIVENNTFDKVGKITISLGLARFDDNNSKEKCIKEADLALYNSKESGRNKVTYYNDIKDTLKLNNGIS